MLQHALKIGLIVVVLGLVVQDANAFGHRGGCGYGGCGYGGYLNSSSGGYSSRPLVSSSRPNLDSALLTVSVPADAKVFVNGQPTRSTGELRQYASSGLEPAAVYGYRVRAEFVRNGKPISEEKTVQLTAGQTSSLSFSAAPNAQVADVATSAVR
jgi:uncharacterized protein (TIGR03000 family)